MENEAKKVFESLENGKNFKEIAIEMSVAPSKEGGGDEGFVPLDILPSPVKEKLIALKSGEYTKEAIKTERGFHIFKVDENRDIVRENDIIDKIIFKKEHDAETKKWFERHKSEIRKLATFEKLNDSSDQRLFFKLGASANEWLDKNNIVWTKLLQALSPSEKNVLVYKEDRQAFIANIRYSYEALKIHPDIIQVMLDYFQSMFVAFDEKIGSSNLHSHEREIIAASLAISPSHVFNTMLAIIKLKIKLEKLNKNLCPEMWRYLNQ
jgi:hypothetical protein